jgi:hypothetical protein
MLTGASLNLYLEFLNNWAINSSTGYTSQAVDIRILRGGYAMLVPAVWSESIYIRTDPSSKIFFDLNLNGSLSENQSARYYSLQPGVSCTPINTLKVSISLNISGNRDYLQYVDTRTVGGNNRYILAKIDERTLGATFRIDYNITPELSIQYYGSPFASVGKYSEFKSVTNPQASEYGDRFIVLNPILNGNSYGVSENNTASIDYSFSNPDFSFSQFRSNLVFRWEYLPGSYIFFVWSQDRTNFIIPGDNSVNAAMGNLRNIYPNNILLMKINYWFSL